MGKKAEAAVKKLGTEPITLREYLLIRGSNALTNAETRVLGLRWPLAHGWIDDYQPLISIETYQRLVKARVDRKAAKKAEAGTKELPLAKPKQAGPICKHCGHPIKFEQYEWDHQTRWKVRDRDGKPHDCAKHWLAAHDKPMAKKKRRSNQAAPATVPAVTLMADDSLPERTCSCPPWGECDCTRSPKDRLPA